MASFLDSVNAAAAQSAPLVGPAPAPTQTGAPQLSMAAVNQAAAQSATPSAPAAPPPQDAGSSPFMSAVNAAAAQSAPLNGEAPTPPAAAGAPQPTRNPIRAGAAALVNGVAGLPGEIAGGVDWLAKNAGRPVAGLRSGIGQPIATQADVDNYKPQGAAADISQGAEAVQGTLSQAGQGIRALIGKSKLGQKAENYVNATPEGLVANLAYGAGSLLPFALAPEADGPGLLLRAAKMAGTGALSGAGGYAGNLVGGSAGQAIGAFAGAMAPAGLAAAGDKISEALADVFPVTKASQQKQALLTLHHEVPDIADVRAKIQARMQPGASINLANGQSVPLGDNGSIIPGAPATAAQISGNPNLARLEEGLKAMPAGVGQSLQDVQDAQSTAAAGTVRGLSPEDAAPSKLSDYLNLEQKRYETQKAVALKTVPGLAGDVEPFQASRLQNAIAAPEAQLAKQNSAIYNKLATKNPVLNMSPLAETVKGITDQAAANKADISSADASLLARAQNLGTSQDTTYGQVEQLRKDLNRHLDTLTGPYGRPLPEQWHMKALKSGIDSAMNAAIDQLPAQSPEWAKALEDEARRWQQATTADERAAIIGGGPGGPPTAAGTPGAGPAEPGAPPPTPNGVGQGPGGPPHPPGPQGVGEPPLGGGPPVWTAEDQQAIQQARAAHADRMTRYWNDNIAPLLQKSPNGKFDMAGDEVISKAVPSGPEGAQMARAIKAVAPDNQEITNHYQTVLGLNLRSAAEKAGGLSDKVIANWIRAKSGILREMPDVAHAVSGVQEAHEFVNSAVQNRVAAADLFKMKAVQSAMGGAAPEQIGQHLLNASPADIKTFLRQVNQHAGALAGAKKAVADHLADRLLTPKNDGTEGVNIATVRAMLRNPSVMSNIREILGPEAPATLQRVLHQHDFYNTAAMSKLSQAGSRTTPLAETVKSINAPKTILGHLLAEAANPIGDTLAAGLAHPAAAVPAWISSTALKGWANSARLKSARVLSEMLSDPKIFMEATKPVPTGTEGAKFLRRFSAALAAAAMQPTASSK
jgi:hypothetical protein